MPDVLSGTGVSPGTVGGPVAKMATVGLGEAGVRELSERDRAQRPKGPCLFTGDKYDRITSEHTAVVGYYAPALVRSYVR